MKKHLFKTVLPTLLLITAVFLIGSSCDTGKSGSPKSDSPKCGTTEMLFDRMVYNNLTDFRDYKVHEYQFMVTESYTVCSIGYKSYKDDYGQDNSEVVYTLEIFPTNNPTDVIIHNSTFSSDEIEFVYFEDLELEKDVPYTIRRTGGDGYASSLGYVVNRDEDSFPYEETPGGNKIISSILGSDEEGGVSVSNIAVPKIYIRVDN